MILNPDKIKILKGASIIGSSAEAAVVKEMLRMLAASVYGALRFFLVLDANPGAQLAVGGVGCCGCSVFL